MVKALSDEIIPKLKGETTGEVLWSGVLNSASSDTIALSQPLSKYKRIKLVLQISAWNPNSENPGFVTEVFNNGWGFTAPVSISYTRSSEVADLHGTITSTDTTHIKFDASRSRSVIISASGAVTSQSDTTGSISLTKIIGYK